MSIEASRQDGSYPRPQLVRAHHVALDRVVMFAHDDDDVGRAEHWERSDAPFTRTIQLPFPPESPASLIGATGFHPVVWYRIRITEADLAAAGVGPERARVLLHFGAVDYDADVWVNGQHVVAHRGGQTAFRADITDALQSGPADQWIVVRAADDPQDPAMPRGKQDWHEVPHGIWYERTTGIWRTAWLEAVPRLHIERILWRAEPQWSSAAATIELNARPADPVTVRIALTCDGIALGALTASLDSQINEVRIPIIRSRDGHIDDELLWSPESPRLIDATITLFDGAPVADGQGGMDARPIDTVSSYFGIRSVAIGGGQFRLNGQPRILRAVLEQGYWPESHLAAPSNAALRDEVALIKELGFDTARIHQKVEDPRFLFWADRLGIMLWGEIGAAAEFSPDAVARLTDEWLQTVRDTASHPSIVTWVPFNESWGIPEIGADRAQQAFCAGLTALTRALDPSRPVISNDGWEHMSSDIWTIHDYESSGDILRERYGSAKQIRQLLTGMGPAGRPMSAIPQVMSPDVPVMLTEFGGVSFVAGATTGEQWGYSSAADADEYLQRLAEILDAVTASTVLAGFCYTQLTDTRQETNGLCDEHRVPKLPAATIAALIHGTPNAQDLPRSVVN